MPRPTPVILPHAVQYNRMPRRKAMVRITLALEGADGGRADFYDLAKAIGAPLALRDLGMKESALEEAAQLANAELLLQPAADRARGHPPTVARRLEGNRPG